MDELVILGSDSHSLSGCDRVSLTGGKVLVQGKPRAAYPDGSPLRLPEDEVISAISPEVFLAAADELRRRLGRS